MAAIISCYSGFNKYVVLVKNSGYGNHSSIFCKDRRYSVAYCSKPQDPRDVAYFFSYKAAKKMFNKEMRGKGYTFKEVEDISKVDPFKFLWNYKTKQQGKIIYYEIRYLERLPESFRREIPEALSFLMEDEKRRK